MKVRRDFTESALIDWIRKTSPGSGRHPLGIGDDCAILRAGGSGQFVLTTDMLLEGVHFEPGTSGYRIGWKAAGRSLSDIAAMGCPASALTACLVFTRGTERRFARDILRGMRSLAGRFEVPLVGGDVSSWEGPLAVNVTAVGDVGDRAPVLRSGARPGDRIFVSGSLGGSIRGRHLRFVPRLELGCALAEKFELSSMIDISDGLARDLGHLTEESGTGAKLSAERIPVSRDAQHLARTSGRCALEHALFDGEDYELLFTASPDQSRSILAAELPVPVSPIGEITRDGLVLEERDGRQTPLPARGYEHQL